MQPSDRKPAGPRDATPPSPATESVATVQNGNGDTIAYLLQDGSKDVTITCTPLPVYLCDGARLGAVIADDLDPGNNAAGGE